MSVDILVLYVVTKFCNSSVTKRINSSVCSLCSYECKSCNSVMLLGDYKQSNVNSEQCNFHHLVI